MYTDAPTRRLEEGLPRISMLSPTLLAKIKAKQEPEQPAKKRVRGLVNKRKLKKQVMDAAKAKPARIITEAMADAEETRKIIRDAEARAVEIRAEADAELQKLADSLTTIKPGSVRGIIIEVADRFGLSHEDIVGPSRAAGVVTARYAAIAAVHLKRPDVSIAAMGRLFGGRDHTTIIHALRKGRAYKGDVAA